MSPPNPVRPDEPWRVLVTGVAGQDGWYLARHLVDAGHEVHGVVRDPAQVALVEAEHPGLVAHVADLTSTEAVTAAVRASDPTHVVNLAGGTSVARSWAEPVDMADVLAVGPVRLLESVWRLQEQRDRPMRFVQASSAEVFGDPPTVPQDESTPHAPVTPYGAAKAFAHRMVGIYRDRGLFASNAVLYNHESPRRGEGFVSRKIVRGVVAVSRGECDSIALGNLDVTRDWGFAGDHVAAMATMLAAAVPGDFVVATGEARTVREFVHAAFAVVGIDDPEPHVRIDPALFRPADPATLVGDASRLRALGWTPTLGFDDLVRVMVEAELARR